MTRRSPEPTKATLFLCSCMHQDHELVAEPFDDGDTEDPIFCLNVRLMPGPLGKRVKQAIRYVFNRTCGYLTSAEFIIRPSDLPRLREMLDKFEADTKHGTVQ